MRSVRCRASPRPLTTLIAPWRSASASRRSNAARSAAEGKSAGARSAGWRVRSGTHSTRSRRMPKMSRALPALTSFRRLLRCLLAPCPEPFHAAVLRIGCLHLGLSSWSNPFGIHGNAIRAAHARHRDDAIHRFKECRSVNLGCRDHQLEPEITVERDEILSVTDIQLVEGFVKGYQAHAFGAALASPFGEVNGHHARGNCHIIGRLTLPSGQKSNQLRESLLFACLIFEE